VRGGWSRGLLRRRRRAQGHAAEPPAPAALPGRHGAADQPRRARPARSQGRRPALGQAADRLRPRADHLRAQYTAGRIGGREIPAYVDEDGVDPAHRTETFAEIELALDNWPGRIPCSGYGPARRSPPIASRWLSTSVTCRTSGSPTAGRDTQPAQVRPGARIGQPRADRHRPARANPLADVPGGRARAWRTARLRPAVARGDQRGHGAGHPRRRGRGVMAGRRAGTRGMVARPCPADDLSRRISRTRPGRYGCAQLMCRLRAAGPGLRNRVVLAAGWPRVMVSGPR
jgi:hypothetical protein